MRKVVIVQAVWPSTGSQFMQAFEDRSAAQARYNELKEDSGAQVSLIQTSFKSIAELGVLIMRYDRENVGQLQ